MQSKVLNLLRSPKLSRTISPNGLICQIQNISKTNHYHYLSLAAPHTFNITVHAPYLIANNKFHLPVNLQSKEPSKVEETVKILKEANKTQEDDVTKSVEKLSVSVPVCSAPKRSISKRIWDEIVHYYHGFRLLFVDIKVSSKLLLKILHGEALTRREHRQLVRTVSDVFRLVPFSMFILVPFMELLLPLFLKFFPQMLPSTFQSSSEREMKFKTQLKMKIEMAKFLQDTLHEMSVVAKGEAHSESAKKFAEFFERIRTTGAQANNEEILMFSKLFEDEITLDSLSRPQLIALCRVLELQPFGTNNFLRFQLRNRIRSLRADDKMIMLEGLDSMTVAEIQQACRARGMRALGISEDRLKSQLKQWLQLSLDEKIPPSLLLLSRALYLPEKIPTTEKLKVTLSSLSDTAATETKFKIGEMEGKVDNKTKLELIKKEEEEIRKEAEELKQQLLDEQKKEDIEEIKIDEKSNLDQFDKEVMIDKAAILEDDSEQLGKQVPQSKTDELSKEDFEEIESALENIATEKHKLLIEKEEIEDLKEGMAEYKQDIKELKDAVLETGHKEISESKAALRLSNKVDKMISKMDKVIVDLNKERFNLQQQIDDKLREGASILKERDDIISVNELVLAIRRIQKVSDDTKLQRIADVLEKMDIDHDGAVEIDHVLKVIELLGEDNVKVTTKQMDDIIELLMKEGILELEEKMKQKQMENENSVNEKSGQPEK